MDFLRVVSRVEYRFQLRAYLFAEKIENELTEQSNDNLISKRPAAEKQRRLFNEYNEVRKLSCVRYNN